MATLTPIADKAPGAPLWIPTIPYEGAATQEVRSRFAVASSMAQDAWDRAERTLQELLWTSIHIGNLLDVEWDVPPLPEMETVADPYEESYPNKPLLTVGSSPNYTHSDPVLCGFPNAPDYSIPAFPPPPLHVAAPSDPNLPAPDVGSIDVPAAPVLVFPNQPELYPIPIPTKPDVVVPPWEGPDLPSDDGLDMPERQFEYDDIGHYTSDLLDQLKSNLTSILIDGGTGLHPDVEQAIYDRAFIRQDTEKIRRQAEAYNAIAGRGFNLPTGVLASALTEIDKEFSRQLREVNMDILVKQAELAQQNTHFAMQLTQQLEAVLMQDWQATAQRLFGIAAKEYELFMEYYRNRAQIYNLRLEGYKAYAQAYEARLRGELAKVEIYKGELEGARLTAEVQKLGVDLYMTLMQALGVRVDLYKAQMQAAAIEFEIEKAKVDLYKTQYDAFATRVNAFKTVWDAYGSQVSAVGEQIKGEMMKIQLYGTEVDAVAKERDSVIKSKELEVDVFKARIQAYMTELEKYKAQYNVYAAQIEAVSKQNIARIEKYKADTGRNVAQYQADVQAFDSKIKESATKAQLGMEAAKVNIENEKHTVGIKIERLKHATGVLAQVAASALGAVNASAQIGFSANYGETLSNSFDQRYSDSRSDSTEQKIDYSDAAAEE